MVALIYPTDNEWKSNCEVFYAQQPVAITEDRRLMNFSGSSSWCWKGNTATAIRFKSWNSAKHQCRELWVLPVPMVVSSSLCCDHDILPLAAKIRTKNTFALLSLTQMHPNPVDLSSKSEFRMCVLANFLLSWVRLVHTLKWRRYCNMGIYSAQASLNPEINSVLCCVSLWQVMTAAETYLVSNPGTMFLPMEEKVQTLAREKSSLCRKEALFLWVYQQMLNW